MAKKRVFILAIILAIIIGANVSVLLLFHKHFPTISLALTGSHPIQEASILNKPDSTPPPTQVASNPLGVSIASQLLDSATLPKGWEPVATDGAVIAPSLLLRCPDPRVTQPALEKSLALRKSNAGILLSVSVYSAGLGAKAFDEISKKIRNCYGFWSSNDVHLGTESIAVNDSGALEGSGSNGRTIWVRAGDVIGMIAIRGGGSNYLADQIATSWIPNWASVLTPTVCPDLNSTLADASRSPFSGNYTGLVATHKIVLSDTEMSSALANGDNLVRQAAISMNSTDVSIPDSPLPTPAADPLVKYPSSISPIFPINKPNAPGNPPSFPAAPEATSVSGRFTDTVGPGCGWALTDMLPPPGLSQQDADNMTALVTSSKNSLSVAISQYSVDRWKYQILQNRYISAVQTWNTWVALANKAIVDALWANYDQAFLAYNQNEANYLQAYSDWQKTCGNSVPTPTPSPSPTDSSAPSPSPTDSGSPSPIATSTCGPQPIEPVKPIMPVQPRNQ